MIQPTPAFTPIVSSGRTVPVTRQQARAGEPSESVTLSGVANSSAAELPVARGTKYALFDFDGTLSRGFISLGFMDHLHESGLYDEGEYAHQQDILAQYKAKTLSYDDWVQEWGVSWARGLKGQSVSAVEGAARTFFETYRQNIFPEARPIVTYLAAQGLSNVMVSAGVFEVMDVARQSLGLQSTIATRCKVEDGRYTGELATRLHTADGKGEVVEAMSREAGPPAFAFGDSSGDIPMLSRAVVPVALNPNAELSKAATERGWAQMPISDALGFLHDAVEKRAPYS